MTGTTNGFWAKNLSSGLEYAKELKKAGVTGLELSADYWHQQNIFAKTISNCIDVCKEVGIYVTLRMLSNKNHSHREALLSLRKNSLEKVDRITCNKVFFVGRARKTMSSNDFYKSGAFGKCDKMLNLVVNSKGRVYPCCAGLEQTEYFSFGNIDNSTLKEIVDNIHNSDLFKLITHFGVEKIWIILDQSVESYHLLILMVICVNYVG